MTPVPAHSTEPGCWVIDPATGGMAPDPDYPAKPATQCPAGPQNIPTDEEVDK